MSRDRPLVIVNPKAGGGFSERKAARLIGAVSEGLGEVDLAYTEAPRHATELARAGALDGRKLVVAFGGDGTVSEVVSGLLAARQAGAARTELGIIPRGTGGDFRRTLELSQDIAEAARQVRERPAHVIDVGQATFTTADGAAETRHFVNVASFGFSSAVAARANDSSKAFGAKVAFLGAVVRTLVAHENTEVFLELDGAPPVRRTMMLGAVGNGRYFGGGMKICPDAKLDSGVLSFVTVGDFSAAHTLANIHKLFAGTHLSLDDVYATTVRTVRVTPVEAAARIPVELDGETPGFTLPALFEIVPAALAVRF
ncbi:MAG TPA: diacylglycerol kinase family protein [Polyangia bacterium]|jgi:YegS/Rv2252/BmrU family lipid kinase